MTFSKEGLHSAILGVGSRYCRGKPLQEDVYVLPISRRAKIHYLLASSLSPLIERHKGDLLLS